MTNWVMRNEEMVCVPLDELTEEECEFVAFCTESDMWTEVWVWISRQNDVYTEEEE